MDLYRIGVRRPSRAEMIAELEALQQALPDLPSLNIGSPGNDKITLSPLDGDAGATESAAADGGSGLAGA